MEQVKKIIFSDYDTYLKPRDKNWHKGLSGHVLVIGGGSGFSGAPMMAAQAALRVGAGLVSVATHPDSFLTINTRPEIMVHAVEDQAALLPLLEKATVLVLGPGLTLTSWGKMLYDAARHSTLPMVLDADGLNLLAQEKNKNTNWILTPHPGEAARLLGLTAAAIQTDRVNAIQTLQSQFGGVVVLKGAGTLVRGEDDQTWLCDKGNPGMATAGMGDVLSGVIGGLLAQGLPLIVAAQLGVYVHAVAGDMAAKAGERGTIATDLLPFLRTLVNMRNE